MNNVNVPQSVPIAAVLAALGGILEVFATAALAYPAARILEGYEWTDLQLKGCLAANIILQILASLSGNLFGVWFGPVAIVGPIFFATQLLANLLVFWIVLGLEAFSREMQIGTYVIVVSVVLLIVNGPQEQDYGDASFHDLITKLYAWIWALILMISMLVAGFIVCFVDLQKRKIWFRFVVLLVARATAFSLNLTAGKALILPADKFWLIVNICIKIVSGIIYTKAIVVQSTAVEQKVFVPLNAAFIVFVNALTGIAIWRDFEVVQSWVGYSCVFLLLALGCGLLLGDLGLLQETSPETFRGARPSMFIKAERTKLLEKLKAFGTIQEEEDMEGRMSQEPEESIPSPKTPQEVSPPLDRRDQMSHFGGRQRSARFGRQRSVRSRAAWMSLYSQAANAHPRGSPRDSHELIRWQSLRRQLELEMSASDFRSLCSNQPGDLHPTLSDGSFHLEKRTRFADEVAPEAALAPPARMTSLDENADENDESSSCDVVESTNNTITQMDNTDTSDPKDSEKSYTSWSA